MTERLHTNEITIIEKIDIQNSEDPERVMGSVITLCSTPASTSGNQLQDVNIETPPQEEPLQ